jgi:SRSO17 transposase
MDAAQIHEWEQGQFELMMERFARFFPRKDLRRQAEGYVRELLGDVERKNSWQLAKQMGQKKPYGIQRLLGRATWSADDVRDELMRYLTENLATDFDPGVLIVGETRFLKKGSKSVGVARVLKSHTGIASENRQVGIFLALATSRGAARKWRVFVSNQCGIECDFATRVFGAIDETE